MSRPIPAKRNMKYHCVFCKHVHREEAERMWILRKKSQREIAEFLGIGTSAVCRHLRYHVKADTVPISYDKIEVEAKSLSVFPTFVENDVLTVKEKIVKRLHEIDELVHYLSTLHEDEMSISVKVDKLIACFRESRMTIETMAKICEIQQEQRKVDGTLNKLEIEVVYLCERCGRKDRDQGTVDRG